MQGTFLKNRVSLCSPSCPEFTLPLVSWVLRRVCPHIWLRREMLFPKPSKWQQRINWGAPSGQTEPADYWNYLIIWAFDENEFLWVRPRHPETEGQRWGEAHGWLTGCKYTWEWIVTTAVARVTDWTGKHGCPIFKSGCYTSRGHNLTLRPGAA